jgi:uncharacterized protein (DUF608 family)
MPAEDIQNNSITLLQRDFRVYLEKSLFSHVIKDQKFTKMMVTNHYYILPVENQDQTFLGDGLDGAFQLCILYLKDILPAIKLSFILL